MYLHPQNHGFTHFTYTADKKFCFLRNLVYYSVKCELKMTIQQAEITVKGLVSLQWVVTSLWVFLNEAILWVILALRCWDVCFTNEINKLFWEGMRKNKKAILLVENFLVKGEKIISERKIVFKSTINSYCVQCVSDYILWYIQTRNTASLKPQKPLKLPLAHFAFPFFRYLSVVCFLFRK